MMAWLHLQYFRWKRDLDWQSSWIIHLRWRHCWLGYKNNVHMIMKKRIKYRNKWLSNPTYVD